MGVDKVYFMHLIIYVQVLGLLAVYLCLFSLHPWEKEEGRFNGQSVQFDWLRHEE